MELEELRNRYLKFFEREGHVIIPSSSLVPENDPTTLFTGAGMQPILPFLLGAKHPEGTRLVDSQKCFRAEDMDEVGDNRHTTFFEMLGNWSLGDYFKQEQLKWFFNFLTDDLEIPAEKLYVTVFAGDESLNLPKDTDSVEIWKELFKKKDIDAKDVRIGSEKNGGEVGMQNGRIFYYDSKKNWWSRAGSPEKMPTGEPGGPDSEVFFEFTHIEHDTRYGAKCHPNCDCGRFMEIGNSVFMEYVKAEDGSFRKLPQRNVDFGGGLERICAALLNTPDVFTIDVFAAAIKTLEERSGEKYQSGDPVKQKAFRIIADHFRAAVFLTASGIEPGNKERAYILRRLVRRALVSASRINLKDASWVQDIVSSYCDVYADFYNELGDRKESIVNILTLEADKFNVTLKAGLKAFQDFADSKEGLTPKNIFDLYQSYGFPSELSLELATERGIKVDTEALYSYIEKHKEASRAGSEKRFKGGLADTSQMSVRYHTATHLLNQTLRQVLGPHVYQK